VRCESLEDGCGGCSGEGDGGFGTEVIVGDEEDEGEQDEVYGGCYGLARAC